jgi:hypothetical protein
VDFVNCSTLTRFGKFEEITVLMEKHVILTQTQVISTQWTLKRPKIIKDQIFSKAKGQKIQILLFFQ